MWDWSIVSVIWLCLAIAAILGGIIGWLLKSLSCSKKCAEYEDQITRLKASSASVKSTASVSGDSGDAAEWKKKATSLEADLRICQDRQVTIEGELKDWSVKSVGLSSVGAAVASGGDTSKLQAEIDELKTKLSETENERVYLLDRVKKAESGETLKVVPMEERDDLELINGVGPVLERMLYDMGVYFFKDIAGWDAAKIVEMNEKLPNFRGRIEREGWVESAKEEHFKKYGERL